MHGEKGENCFYPNFLFLGLWPSHPMYGSMHNHWGKSSTTLHTSSNRSLQFENEITKVLPFDSTIEAIESSIVTKGYGIKLVILGTTWEHGGMH